MICLEHEPEPNYVQQYKELRLDSKPISILLLDATARLRSILCNALNYEQLIPNEQSNLPRDYRGLAILLKAPTTEQRNIARSTDPTLNILYYLNSLSTSKLLNNCSSNRTNNSTHLANDTNYAMLNQNANTVINKFCTIQLLMHALEMLGRFDVIDDLVNEMKQNPIDEFVDCETIANNIIPQVNYPDLNTRQYDAYVSYVDDDLSFVQELCNYLESPQINLKLYLRARDLPLGTMEYSYFTELMQKQCKRLVMVLSPQFCESVECEFQTKFTLSLQIEERQRKLIPIIYKSCELPPFIRFFTKIDLSRAHTPQLQRWTMEKLINSLSSTDGRNPPQQRMITNLPSLSIHTLNSSNASTNGSNGSAINNSLFESVSCNRGSEEKKMIPKIKVTDDLDDTKGKLNSINLIDKSSKYLSSSLTTRPFASDTDALIEKQKFKLLSKIWKNISSSLNKR